MTVLSFRASSNSARPISIAKVKRTKSIAAIATVLSMPANVWFALFLFFPFLITVLISLSPTPQGTLTFNINQWTFTPYIRAFSEMTYVNVYIRSLLLATVTSVFCLVIAVPAAYFVAKSSEQRKTIFLFCVFLPLFSSFLVRAYGWRWLLHPESSFGIGLRDFSAFIGVASHNMTTLVGLLSCYLPLMFLPVYVGFDRFNFTLQDAAIDLGASPQRTFFTVVLPNNLTALVSGFSLVFIPTLAEFVIPEFLGGAQTMLVGGLIREQFLKSRNWPFGASLSIILVCFGLLAWWLLSLVEIKDEKKK